MSHPDIQTTGETIIRNPVTRPPHARDRQVRAGMKVYWSDDGRPEARHRAPSGDRKWRLIGTIVSPPTTAHPLKIHFPNT